MEAIISLPNDRLKQNDGVNKKRERQLNGNLLAWLLTNKAKVVRD